MTTAQGADHTAGNLPRLNSREMELPEMMERSLAHQIRVAANDSLGLCIFGMTVTNTNVPFIIDAVNAALGTQLTEEFFSMLGRETLRYEREFNLAAGFTAADDELPAFFYNEALPPTHQTARFHGKEVHGIYDALEPQTA
jgi:aldehyde:ferredoxin oxidoreductase